MLQLESKGPDLWDSVLPDDARVLPEDLARVDEVLRDARFMAPFLSRFDEKTGRRGLPVATYLRLMYLRRLHRLSYDALVGQVASTASWRAFCGIGAQDRLPSPSTLSGLTQKYGEDTLAELYGLVSQDLEEWKILRRARRGSAAKTRAPRSSWPSRLSAGVELAREALRRALGRLAALMPRRRAQMTLNLRSGK